MAIQADTPAVQAGPAIGDSPDLDGSPDSLINVTDNTTDTVENTTTETTDTVENTTTNTTDAVENTTTNTTDAVENTTTNTTDAVENTTTDTTATVDNTTTDTTDGTENGTDSTTDAVDDTTDDTTDGVENATDETTDAVDTTTEGTTDAVENATDETIDAVENVTDGTTDAVENVTDEAGVIVNASDGTIHVGVVTATETDTDHRSDGDSSAEEAATGSDSATESVTETAPRSQTGTATENASGAAGSTRGAGAGDGDTEWNGGGDLSGPLVVMGLAAGAAAGVAALTSSATSALQSPELLHTATTQAKSAVEGSRGWLSSAGDRLWRIAAGLKYSRWDDSDPLEHEGRSAVFDAVEDAPGIYLSALEERTDASLSTLRHHLRILESEGLITSEKLRGKRRYFPIRREGADPALLAAMDDDATEEILTVLAEEGPASGGDLADSLDRDPSTISHHLSRLEDDGLIERERDGRSVRNDLSGTAARALREEPVAADADRPVPAD